MRMNPVSSVLALALALAAIGATACTAATSEAPRVAREERALSAEEPNTGGIEGGGALLRGALEACAFDLLWFKDAAGDLNAGRELSAAPGRLPGIASSDGDTLTFEDSTVAAFSGGWLGGAIRLQLRGIDETTGEWIVAGGIEGTLTSVTLGEARFQPKASTVLSDAVRQNPEGDARIILRDELGGSRSYEAKWGLVRTVGGDCDPW
jgi:hypothetical protein